METKNGYILYKHVTKSRLGKNLKDGQKVKIKIGQIRSSIQYMYILTNASKQYIKIHNVRGIQELPPPADASLPPLVVVFQVAISSSEETLE